MDMPNLLPLLRGHYVDRRAVLNVLFPNDRRGDIFSRWMSPHARSRALATRLDPDEIIVDAKLRIAKNAVEQGGLDCHDEARILGFLHRVSVRAVQDQVKQLLAKKRGARVESTSDDPTAAVVVQVRAEEDGHIEQLTYADLARAAIEQVLAAEFRPNYRLAFLGYHWPSALRADHTADAARQIRRTPEHAWQILVDWIPRYPHGTSEHDEGKVELAWTLLSDDSGRADEWRARLPRAAKDAIDLLRKWHGRAVDVLKAAMPAVGGIL